jgi:hypothetical protein
MMSNIAFQSSSPAPYVAANPHSLAEENARLRAEVDSLRQQMSAAPPTSDDTIQFDLKTNTLTATNIHTNDTTIERLRAHVDGVPVGDLVKQYASAHNAVAANGAPPKLDHLLDEAGLRIEDLRIRVPEATANDALQTVAGDALAKERVKNVHVAFNNDGRIVATGTVHKLFDIPFTVSGRLSAAGDAQVRVALERAKLLSHIPVPHWVTRMVVAAAGGKDGIVRVENKNTYVVKADAYIPDNLQVALSKIETTGGAIIFEAHAPGASR